MNEIGEKVRLVPCDLLAQHDSWVLRGIEEARVVLDDCYSQLLYVKSNPLVRTLIIKLTNLDNKIMLMQDSLEVLGECQRGWLYLFPIFSSPDIERQMPEQKKKFDLLDKLWRSEMDIFRKEEFVADVLESDSHKARFESGLKVIGDIMAHLEHYLEQKRLAFPRFFFLSDEELIEILSKARDPLVIQRHVDKCFEAVASLGFD
jgi:dynein heavy chain